MCLTGGTSTKRACGLLSRFQILKSIWNSNELDRNPNLWKPNLFDIQTCPTFKNFACPLFRHQKCLISGQQCLDFKNYTKNVLKTKLFWNQTVFECLKYFVWISDTFCSPLKGTTNLVVIHSFSVAFKIQRFRIKVPFKSIHNIIVRSM